MKVGELARATGLTVRTLHHWEERGLVVPSARTSSGHRVYDDQDVRSVYQVVALRELGLPLDAIGELLSSGSFADVLTAHLGQGDARLAALHALRGTLAAVVDRLREAPAPTRRSRACRRSRRGGRSCWRPSTTATSRCAGSCTGCGTRTPARWPRRAARTRR